MIEQESLSALSLPVKINLTLRGFGKPDHEALFFTDNTDEETQTRRIT